jgi:hypothetical protein
MQVSKILGNVVTPEGDQVIAQLANGRYAVGMLDVRSEVPEDQQFEDLEMAFDKWYDIIHEDL